MNDTEKCARDILDIIEKVHYSPEFIHFRINKGARGEIEYITDYIKAKYLNM